MISVHAWIQPTQEKTKKPNLEWRTTSATELEESQDLKPSRKIPKTPNLPRLLHNDPWWQQHDFSACMDPTNLRKDQKAKIGVGNHLRHRAGGKRRVEAFPKNPKIAHFAAIVVQGSLLATT